MMPSEQFYDWAIVVILVGALVYVISTILVDAWDNSDEG